MSDLGNLSYFQGVEFIDTGERVFLHQKKYVQYILKRFIMSNCETVATPLKTRTKLKKETHDEFVSATLYKRIFGSLKYLCNTILYIYQSVGLLNRFMEKPQECLLIAIKRVSRYIKGMIDHGVLMSRQKKTSTDVKGYGYTDSDFSGDQDEKKSIAFYIFMIKGALIFCSSGK
ncbi:uncharacterized mitochondrial protein AtMg00810-like [Vicia villosa]|uniref:uncharacterized mitochondrial protein AtMg00810-like n=1 Tax=Vicia villosa TaxID=3911 RepID=UPI00273C7E73|nr:uncharacterized mitochondrial protein AtMg00810-like [Vicia villosa]